MESSKTFGLEMRTGETDESAADDGGRSRLDRVLDRGNTDRHNT